MNMEIDKSKSPMKKVLIIAYHFPPDFAVGGLRIAKFARYLPPNGWEPTILTVEDRYRDQLDRERVKDVGDTRVLKTIKVPKLNSLLLSLKRGVSAGLDARKVKGRNDKGCIYSENSKVPKSESLLRKLKRYYLSLSGIPDRDRNWVIPATVKAMLELKGCRYDCIMTSSPPHSSHLIGLILKKLTKIQWIADFRDPWIDLLPYRAFRLRSNLSDRIEKWLENEVIENADRVITTTDEHRKAVICRFPNENPEKFIYIPNGIDSEKFMICELPERFEKFTISYAGTIYLNRSPEPVFKAIQKLTSLGKIEPAEISFKLFGNCDQIDGKPISMKIAQYGLESVVEVSGPIPFNEALHIMQRSHLVLLLATPVQDINIPAKIYDYFGSRSKIIAITETGATAELINNTNSGVCFSPSDTDGIAEYIFALMRSEERDRIRNDPSHYARFDARLLTEKLAQQLFSL
jgi:glycosyltransferase involved in cell wall biosynthesis